MGLAFPPSLAHHKIKYTLLVGCTLFLLLSVYVASIRTALVNGASKSFSMDMMPSLCRTNIFVPGENILKITIPKSFNTVGYLNQSLFFRRDTEKGVDRDEGMAVMPFVKPFSKHYEDQCLPELMTKPIPGVPVYDKKRVSQAFSLRDRGAFKNKLYEANRIITFEETCLYLFYINLLPDGNNAELFEQDIWKRLDQMMEIVPFREIDKYTQSDSNCLRYRY